MQTELSRFCVGISVFPSLLKKTAQKTRLSASVLTEYNAGALRPDLSNVIIPKKVKDLRMFFNNMSNAGTFFGELSGSIKPHANNKDSDKQFAQYHQYSSLWSKTNHFIFLNIKPTITKIVVKIKLTNTTISLEKSSGGMKKEARNNPKLTWAKAIQTSAQYSPSLSLNLNHIFNKKKALLLIKMVR